MNITTKCITREIRNLKQISCRRYLNKKLISKSTKRMYRQIIIRFRSLKPWTR